MAYRTLSTLFHMDRSTAALANNRSLADERRSADSSFRLGFATDSGELFFAVPRELSVLNEAVLRKERRISSLYSTLPRVARGALVRSLVIDEVVSTNALEGIHSTRRQINELLAEARDARSLSNKRFVELANLYVGLTTDELAVPASAEDIRAIYDRVMQGEDLGDSAPDGMLFRRSGVDIIGNGGKVLHHGLEPEGAIISAIASMIALASSADMPETYSAIAAHYLFEYVHPFYDGNGRTGRYLLALYLSRPLSLLTSLSLSRAIAENKAPYYRAFKEAENPLNHGELTHFVMCIMDYISGAQDGLISDLTEKIAQIETVHQAISELDMDERGHAVLFMLAQYELFAAFPGAGLGEIAQYLEVSEQTARACVKKLEAAGYVETIAKRPLRFTLGSAGLRLLEGGAQGLANA